MLLDTHILLWFLNNDAKLPSKIRNDIENANYSLVIISTDKKFAAYGIIAFITNRSFIDAKAFDGFRKCLEREFNYIYIVDIGGDIRSGDTSGNVFDIKMGVAVMFLVKTTEEKK